MPSKRAPTGRHHPPRRSTRQPRPHSTDDELEATECDHIKVVPRAEPPKVPPGSDDEQPDSSTNNEEDYRSIDDIVPPSAAPNIDLTQLSSEDDDSTGAPSTLLDSPISRPRRSGTAPSRYDEDPVRLIPGRKAST